MLAFDQNQRISLDEIMNHPWFLEDVLTMDQLRDEMLKRVPKKEEFRIKLENKIQVAKHQNAGSDILYRGLMPFRSISLTVFFNKNFEFFQYLKYFSIFLLIILIRKRKII